MDERTQEARLWEETWSHFSSLIMFLQVASGIHPDLNFQCDILFLKFLENDEVVAITTPKEF